MEKFIKRQFTPTDEKENVIQQFYPAELYFIKTYQEDSKVIAQCVTSKKNEYPIEFSLFTKYYERAHENYCTAKHQLDRQLLAVFSIMEQNEFSWKNVHESIEILKNRYPCFNAYIEAEYCKKQEELQKYEPLE